MTTPAFRIVLILAALSGAMAVAAGAFGAHGVADPQARAWLQTGAQYQMVHVVAALVSVAISYRRGLIPAALFIAGGFIFALTLDLMALGGPRVLGAVTPVGGLMLIVGWLALAWSFRAGARRGVPAP
ncbi:MAG: DUF423 domain-containing protein [Caulobacteraceae bacterium]